MIASVSRGHYRAELFGAALSTFQAQFFGRPLISNPQGADVHPKISMLPKVDGQSCCGAGIGAGLPPRSDMRHASTAGQSAALRASCQTAAPYVLVAIP